jgi:glutamate dehydrogenase (NADP+)
MSRNADTLLDALKEKNPGEDEFIQAVSEVLPDLEPVVANNKAFRDEAVLERLCEPDRIVQFRVAWQTDEGETRINRGWRVQHTNAIGPYKGGLRFAPSVNVSVLKFLAFEQTFKNALTGLPMGAAKGGADFDPKGRSRAEVMRFCQAFMNELYRHIGPRTDIPAGDIGVGPREIGFLFGQYKKLTNSFSGALTGKGLEFGGTPMRPEATGYGLVHFLDCIMKAHDNTLDGKRIVISGAGNVALHAAQKATEKGASVLTLSNSDGTLHAENGFSPKAIETIQSGDTRLDGLADDVGAVWKPDALPWSIACDIALPCATQNELGKDDAQDLIENGVTAVAEGANMPCTADAICALGEAGVIFGPAKAANAGGVALSGLEMSQNAAFEMSDAACMSERLETIMGDIHRRCVDHAGKRKGDAPVNYQAGANRAGFQKIADALVAFGIH